MAMDLLPDLHPIFTGNGLEREFKTIKALMEDIEFEAAAEAIADLNFGISHNE